MNARIAASSIALYFAIAPRAQSQEAVDARVERALRGLRPAVAVRGAPPLRWTLQARMAELHVPGVSVAIIDSGRVLWSAAFGVREAGSSALVATTTRFQAQSISKAIAVTGMLALVDAGTLSLDADVDGYLTSWKLPPSRFTDSARVTLRRLASHSAGITPPSYPGYARDSVLPTLIQILQGAPPANAPAIRVDTFPGSVHRYSGGGLLVLQQVLIDRSRQPFDALMKRLVFEKAGMTSSTFAQPLSAELTDSAAVGHDLRGAPIAGKWRVFPELAAAGLWSTASDLARWAVAIAAASNGASNGLISPTMAKEMLTMQAPPAGLGVFLEGSGPSFAFGHSGSTRGYRADLVMFPGVGRGAVVMTNADRGGELSSELMRAIAAEFDWPGRRQRERAAVALSPNDFEGLVGAYDAPRLPDGSRPTINVSSDSARLYFEFLPFNPRLELYAESRDRFFTLSGIGVVFSRDSSDKARTVVLAGQVRGQRRP